MRQYCYSLAGFLQHFYWQYLVIKFQKNRNMEALLITLWGTALIALGFYIWMSYTKSGKKWLKSLG